MPNITLRVDEDVIKRVRRIAVDRNTTLTQMVRDYLVSIARMDSPEKLRAVRQLEGTFRKYSRDMGKRNWTREALYE